MLPTMDTPPCGVITHQAPKIRVRLRPTVATRPRTTCRPRPVTTTRVAMMSSSTPSLGRVPPGAAMLMLAMTAVATCRTPAAIPPKDWAHVGAPIMMPMTTASPAVQWVRPRLATSALKTSALTMAQQPARKIELTMLILTTTAHPTVTPAAMVEPMNRKSINWLT